MDFLENLIDAGKELLDNITGDEADVSDGLESTDTVPLSLDTALDLAPAPEVPLTPEQVDTLDSSEFPSVQVNHDPVFGSSVQFPGEAHARTAGQYIKDNDGYYYKTQYDYLHGINKHKTV